MRRDGLIRPTVLMRASDKGHDKMVEKLAGMGASKNLRDKKSRTAQMLVRGKLSVFGADVPVCNKWRLSWC